MPEQRLRDWFLKQVNLNIKEEFHKINGIEFLPKIWTKIISIPWNPNMQSSFSNNKVPIGKD
jgi:hypothetical protein